MSATALGMWPKIAKRRIFVITVNGLDMLFQNAQSNYQEKYEQHLRQFDQGQTVLHAQTPTTYSESYSSGAMTMTPEKIRDLINSSIASTFTSTNIKVQYKSTALSTSLSPISPSWFLDFGTSNHMTSVE